MEDLHAQHENIAADAARAAATHLSVALAGMHRAKERRAARAAYPVPLTPAPSPRSPTISASQQATTSPATLLRGPHPERQDHERLDHKRLDHDRLVRDVLPDLATALRTDPGWERLVAELDRQHLTTGHSALGLRLHAAAAQRELGSARYPAQVLAHRLAQQQSKPQQQPRSSTSGPATARRSGSATSVVVGRSYPAAPRPPAAARTTAGSPPTSSTPRPSTVTNAANGRPGVRR